MDPEVEQRCQLNQQMQPHGLRAPRHDADMNIIYGERFHTKTVNTYFLEVLKQRTYMAAALPRPRPNATSSNLLRIRLGARLPCTHARGKQTL